MFLFATYQCQAWASFLFYCLQYTLTGHFVHGFVYCPFLQDFYGLFCSGEFIGWLTGVNELSMKKLFFFLPVLCSSKNIPCDLYCFAVSYFYYLSGQLGLRVLFLYSDWVSLRSENLFKWLNVQEITVMPVSQFHSLGH